jgi:hypothetical protein
MFSFMLCWLQRAERARSQPSSLPIHVILWRAHLALRRLKLLVYLFAVSCARLGQFCDPPARHAGPGEGRSPSSRPSSPSSRLLDYVLVARLSTRDGPNTNANRSCNDDTTIPAITHAGRWSHVFGKQAMEGVCNPRPLRNLRHFPPALTLSTTSKAILNQPSQDLVLNIIFPPPC